MDRHGSQAEGRYRSPDGLSSSSNRLEARHFLHWKKTGSFVRNLLDKADATGDARLKAYAYGYLIGYSCRVTASPYINSIVGGPFRTVVAAALRARVS